MYLHYLRKYEFLKLCLFSHAVYQLQAVDVVDEHLVNKPKQCRFLDTVYSTTE